VNTVSHLASRLVETLGLERVVCAPEELLENVVDGIAPAAIVRPQSAEEVAELVKLAVAEQWSLLPLGSRSKSEIGAPLTQYDVAVDMTGLKEVAHYDAGDMTLSVDAGMSLRELGEVLQSHGQFLPLAVPCFETATVGGVVASGIDSVLRQRYGTVRDFLIGAEFVDGSGRLCKSGGRVVKNVTGYDLHKLLIGSLGTLGVITRLNFRTFPLAEMSGGHVATFAKLGAALKYRAAVDSVGIPLTNLEIISSEAIKMMRAILHGQEEQVQTRFVWNDSAWSVYSSFEGTEPLVKRITGELEKVAREAGAQHAQILEPAADEAMGGMLREAFEWLRWAAPGTVLLRLTICGKAEEVTTELQRATQKAGLRAAVLLRSSGVIYFAILSESEIGMAAPVNEIFSAAARLAHARGGFATVLHAPLDVKQKISASKANKNDASLQERVKKAFDPHGIFAPGRVLGAI
jgi:glycolate oxidase FAD binding subunit